MTDNFAAKAAGWDSPEKIKMTDTFVNEVKKRVRPDKTMKVLEVGAGTGLVGLKLLPDVNLVVFVDTSEAMLKVLKSKTSAKDNIEIVHGEVLDYLKNNIDLIVSNMAFHHIPDIEGTLEHLYKICNANAKIIVSDLMSEDGSFHNYEAVPHQGFDPEKLSETFRKVGFTKVENYVYNTLKREKHDGKMHHYDQFILFATR
ncbi:class I SAM-dependent methyltransferase [Saccharicrinis sp. FJH54]|uniref:class I SAM-dependent methyltransferase n=1 Tax=Saccharicrinis sp. FJH54 TaxID=3344665 RepID=UPI0035D52196